MKESLLCIYNKGFLPGPEETEKQFYKRIEITEKILKNPYQYIQIKSLLKTKLTPITSACLLSTGRKNLFIHGSSTLVLEVTQGVNIPVITNPSFLSRLFISKKEILDHELIHARRAQFTISKYEEILAYRTSKSSFRRILSPIISNSKDLLLFITCTSLSCISILPMTFMISILSIKLYYRQKRINKCVSYLKKYTPLYENILNAMTDDEIIAMSLDKMHKINFSLYRWKFLQKLFGNIK